MENEVSVVDLQMDDRAGLARDTMATVSPQTLRAANLKLRTALSPEKIAIQQGIAALLLTGG